jgi:regulator of PEP synthase PpsR (kinase-PPPase family)
VAVHVFIVSDSLGETADLVTRAALSQFDGQDVLTRRFPMVTHPDQIRPIIDEARRERTLIVFTLILPDVHRAMTQLAEQAGVAAVDVMGPMMSGFVQLLGRPPRLQPGLVYQMDAEYFRRVECVEFAVKYDDGKDPRGFAQADAVLLGVSRCSKTPVSMYLAHRKWKVANLPLVPELALPAELLAVPRHKIVGLRVDPDKLAVIRRERIRTMGVKRGDVYADEGRILEEMAYAEEVFARLRCGVIDISHRAVEETAVRVMELVQRADPEGL